MRKMVRWQTVIDEEANAVEKERMKTGRLNMHLLKE